MKSWVITWMTFNQKTQTYQPNPRSCLLRKKFSNKKNLHRQKQYSQGIVRRLVQVKVRHSLAVKVRSSSLRVRLPTGNATARLPPSPPLHSAKSAVRLLAVRWANQEPSLKWMGSNSQSQRRNKERIALFNANYVNKKLVEPMQIDTAKSIEYLICFRLIFRIYSFT